MTKRVISLLTVLLLLLLIAVNPPAAQAAGGAQPGYELTATSEGGVCTLRISVVNAVALTGRIAVSYDTEQLTLQGSGQQAIVMKNDLYMTNDGVDWGKLIDPAGGHIGFAWYGNVLDSRSEAKQVAEVKFTQKAAALDSGSFGLRYVPDKGFGSWISAASVQASDGSAYPYIGAYQRPGYTPLSVRFSYEGAERAPEKGHTVTLRCRDVYGAGVPAEAEWSGRTAAADEKGDIRLTLRAGTYRVRVRAAGYGDRDEVLEVAGEMSRDLAFQTDEKLVEQGKSQLAIGFAEGDSAKAVTRTLTLPYLLENGVAVSWKSSRAEIVTNNGLVYRPAAGSGDAAVTLTATLTYGKAVGEKKFDLKILSKRSDNVPEVRSFTDLRGYDWAKDSIERLSAAGILKGVSATEFKPSAPIKRGDFLLLVMNLMAPAAKSSGAAFADVPAGKYYSNAICAARALGITNGSGENRFMPETYISRQEMAVMVARAMETTGYDTLKSVTGDLSAFSDRVEVAAWAKQDLAKMVGNGHMKGDGGRLRPKANTSRAEAAVFIDRIRQRVQGR